MTGCNLVDLENYSTVKDENSWTRVGWNLFRGKELTGWTVLTIVDGIQCLNVLRSPGKKVAYWLTRDG